MKYVIKTILYATIFITFPVTANDFDRHYLPGVTLSQEQEEIVIQLAQQAGISNIAALAIATCHPGDCREIIVTEQETVHERTVTYRFLPIV